MDMRAWALLARPQVNLIAARAIRQAVRFNSSVSRSPTEQYDYLVSQQKIRFDQYQRDIVSSLHYLHDELIRYQPNPILPTKQGGFLSKLFGGSSKVSYSQPKGIYLYGDVGCGKTMLMDMFFTTVPQHLTKQRIHFHSFMQGVHHRSHELKSTLGDHVDTTREVANEIARDSNVLCFDEFQVVDVADAMILRRLFDMLYEHGVVTFMTSNRPPDELYKNGVQRVTFIPCIEQIKQLNKVIFLDSPTDYRKIDRPPSGTYFFPPSGRSLDDVKSQADEHISKWFDYFSQGREVKTDYKVEVWGRSIDVPKCSPQSVAQFTFDQLCGTPRSAADYLELTQCFPAFVLTDIPALSIRRTDLTRRFITFLDAAYESHSKLAVTAEKPFEHLFNADDTSTVKTAQTLSKEDLDGDLLSDGTLFSGEEEKFAYARTLSRLKQMSSQQWIDHIRL